MKTDVRIYLATPMTGLYCDEIWVKAINDSQKYEKEGVTVVTPIAGEGIPFDHVKLQDRTPEEMRRVWKFKDKGAIKDTHVLVYECPDRWSQGVAHELVLARGVLWKPVVFVGRNAGFITREEDDYVAMTHEEAAMVVRLRWGTRRKRIIWRLKMLNRCLLGWLADQLKEFK